MNEDETAQPSQAEPRPSAENGRKSRLSCRSCALIAVVLFVVLPIGACSFFIWLPDSIPPHEWKTIGRATLPRGQEIYVFQKWDSDFYVTAIVTKEKDRPALVYVVDGDDTKQWWADVQVDPEREQVTVGLSRGRTFTYSGISGDLSEAGYPMQGDSIEQYGSASWPPFPIDGSSSAK